jgi:hypothetical protein
VKKLGKKRGRDLVNRFVSDILKGEFLQRRTIESQGLVSNGLPFPNPISKGSFI